MAKKSLGHLQLQWTCPSCQTLNPGPVKVCQNCGMPQPENSEFEIRAGEKITQNQGEINKNPDIHCPYCGTRNPADAKVCSQCGGNIEEGLKRKTGQVLGSYSEKQPEKISCPSCGFENESKAGYCEKCGGSLKTPESSKTDRIPSRKPLQEKSAPQKQKKISPILIIFIILVSLGFLTVCIILIGALTKTEELTGRVENLHWERSIIVEELTPVTKEDWANNIPSDAILFNCSMEYRYTSQNPEPVSTEVCGTPYVVDEGTGYGEVVQNCEYLVYDESCSYEVEEWQAATTYSLDGYDNQAVWPDPQLGYNQRLGAQNETYQILFVTDEGDFTYTTSNYGEFMEYPLNSEWKLSINGFNAIKEISPAN